jgi:uncharacterized membrane protein
MSKVSPQKISHWVEKDLISAEQAEAILAYENSAVSRPWMLYGFYGIGILAIVVGSISLVAANWMSIPEQIKIPSYLILQFAATLFAIRNLNSPGILRELSLAFTALFFLAGIGLTAQIFNLHSEGWQGILFWLLLMLPSVLLAHTAITSRIWYAGYATAVALWYSNNHSMVPDETVKFLVLCSLLVWVTVVSDFGRSILPGVKHFFEVGYKTSLLFLILCGSIMCNVLWVELRHRTCEQLERVNLLIPWLPLAILIFLIFINPKRNYKTKQYFITTYSLIGILSTLPFFIDPHLMPSILKQLIGCAAFLAIWVNIALAAASARHKRLFDLASLCIAARVIVIYFEVFGSLTTTGIGLIVSGVFILFVVYVWHRSKPILSEIAEDVA